MVRVFSKDVGDTKVVYRKECEVVITFEDRIEERIKRDLGRLWI